MAGSSHGAPPEPAPLPRRPRMGSVDRPINGRLYRNAWLVMALPLLVAAFTVGRPAPLPREVASLQPSFDGETAAANARALAETYPDRAPGSPASPGAARWVREQLESYGLDTDIDVFSGAIPGRGRVELTNVVGVVPGDSRDTIVVVAHRDSTSGRRSANDNASGTAALLELARAYAVTRTGAAGGVNPRHTLVFLSTDSGAYGLLGARRFAKESPHASRTVAVLNLDTIASSSRPRLELSGRGPRSPAPGLVATVSARVGEETGRAPERPSVLAQLVDLAFPLSLHEQDPFLARGIPAVTITTGGGLGEDQAVLDTARLGQLGRAAEATIASVDASLELSRGTGSVLYVGSRTVQGWAVAFLLVTMALPFALGLVDLLALLRRRGISLRPAIRSYLRRLAFWLWVGAAFAVFGLVGAWPDGDAAPINPDSQAAGHWPRLGLVALTMVVLTGWFVARARLVRRGPVAAEDELAGYAAALGAVGLVVFVTIVTNPYALLFLLPSAHAWLWLPQARERGPVRSLLLAAGFLGPVLLLLSVAIRFGLGLDAPWYLAELTAIGYVPIMAVLLFLVWAAAAGQVVAVTIGRYAPYPAPAERPVRGSIGELVFAVRARRLRRHMPGPPKSSGDTG